MSHSMDDFLPYKITNIEEPSLLPQLKEINESSESRAKCLEILRRELKNLKEIEPCLEESFLLRFLRVSKFNTSNAFQRILKYYKHHEILLDALRKLSLPLQKARRLNHAWVSPYRLKNNSFVLFALGGKGLQAETYSELHLGSGVDSVLFSNSYKNRFSPRTQDSIVKGINIQGAHLGKSDPLNFRPTITIVIKVVSKYSKTSMRYVKRPLTASLSG
ncbi:hypothetical protein AVEN_121465-1 [Araneus ventricosus]|uniref:CRAL/TRIO N-terminal domain-containing protein n=1 Tax=Araneus ventricosus TaxID=182803 RepID=A0A4Y2SQT4_ARAVE|nr:hypothetical protein AVEN_121465-1 [Araneus ventricosus]